MKSFTLLTPTYHRDFDRFAFQRESIERCGIDLPHVAIVHDSDVELFKSIPHRRNLRILSTREVLGAKLERRRRAWQVRRLNYLHWLIRKPIAGWISQQLVKLAASEWVETEGIICLDSDTFFIDRVIAEDFYTDDRIHLYETANNLDVEMAGWLADSMRFLGVAAVGKPLMQYVHHPVCLHRQVLKDLHQHIEARHSEPWMEAFLRTGVFEYMTYGAFARHVHQLKLVKPIEPSLTLSYWWPDQAERFGDEFLEKVRESKFKIVLMQSNSGKNPCAFRSLIEEAWELRSMDTSIRKAVSGPACG